jgi:hypothetical protein
MKTTESAAPYRDDPCAGVRAELADAKERLAKADDLIARAAAERDRLRAKLAIRRAGSAVGAGATAGALILLAFGVVAMARSCKPPPSPSPGERMAASRAAATQFLGTIFPGEPIHVTCRRVDPLSTGANPSAEPTWQTDEACLAIVGSRSFVVNCSDQIGGANTGCSGLSIAGLR